MKKKFFLGLIFAICCVVFSYTIYPRISDIDLVPTVDLDLKKAVINYSVKEKELDLKKGVAKGIYWSQRKPAEAPFFYSICYLHGFSATRKELSPIIELVGDKLGAPIVFSRLEGHGMNDFDALGKSTVKGWMQDALDCFEMASRIGEKVIMIGTSTGATLATYLATYYKEPHKIIMLSPNFKIANKFFPLLSGPFGPIVARLYFGKTRKIPHAYNDDFKYYWTEEYHSSALSTLSNLLRNLNKNDFKKIEADILMLTTPNDKIIDLKEVESFAKIKRPGKTEWLSKSEFRNHNLAGDIVDPSNNELLIEIISSFIPAP